MLKSIVCVLLYVIQRVLFVAIMIGVPTLITMVSFKGRKVNVNTKIQRDKIYIYIYSIILTGILLAIILKKVGL